MTDPKNRRRWFQFSLKGLLIFVTIFCGWLGWQVHTVRSRLAWRHTIEERGGYCVLMNSSDGSQLPWFRRMLGDEDVGAVILYPNCSEEEKIRIESEFPEILSGKA